MPIADKTNYLIFKDLILLVKDIENVRASSEAAGDMKALTYAGIFVNFTSLSSDLMAEEKDGNTGTIHQLISRNECPSRGCNLGGIRLSPFSPRQKTKLNVKAGGT